MSPYVPTSLPTLSQEHADYLRARAMLRLALERHQTVPTRKITGRSRLQSGRCSRCANECRGWSEWRAGRPRCSLTSRDRRMRCCGARTSKRRRCGLVTHPYRLRQLSSPQYDRRNSSPPVETIRAGLTNVGHSLNRGGERPWQEIADLLEWLKRSPALPHPPSSDVGLKVDPNLAPGLQLPRSRKHCVRETTSCCVLLAAFFHLPFTLLGPIRRRGRGILVFRLASLLVVVLAI